MAKTKEKVDKKVVEVVKEVVELATEPEVTSKAEYRKLIEVYAEKYPAAYEVKKERLLAKLESL